MPTRRSRSGLSLMMTGEQHRVFTKHERGGTRESGWCAMSRVGSGIVSLYRAFVHVKGSLIPRDPSYDSLWIITQRTRREYIRTRARSVNVARCPAYIARLCFHTYFSNAPRSIILDNSGPACFAGNEAGEKSFRYHPPLFSFFPRWLKTAIFSILRTILTDKLFF